MSHSTFKFQLNCGHPQITGGAGNAISRSPKTALAPASWTQISPVFNGFSNIQPVSYSSDGSKLFFFVDDQTDAIFRLYRMNPDGTAAAAINGATFDHTVIGGTPSILSISADNKRLIARSGNDLFAVNLENNTTVRLTNRTQTTSVISGYFLINDAKNIFYVANQNDLGIKELFKVLISF